MEAVGRRFGVRARDHHRRAAATRANSRARQNLVCPLDEREWREDARLRGNEWDGGKNIL